MAAYAALVSLMHIIDQIEHHPCPPITLDKNQVESLTEKIVFLQEFLEGYSRHVVYNHEADAFEIRIVDAAYAAEDVIESHIVDQIHGLSTSRGEIMSSIEFHEGLEKVIEDMDLIKKEAMQMTEENLGVKVQLHRNLPISSDSRRSHSLRRSTTMMGSDDVLTEVLDKLTGKQRSLQIIPIVGMGGIGKTTLAANIYSKQLIKEHFDICAWVSISQVYYTWEILSALLSQVKKVGRHDLTENELGEELYKYLIGRRYLIVMDDMWSIEAWEKVKIYFPDNNNGSRIMVTTRISNLAFQLTGSYGFHMKPLDEEKSWDLFHDIVFGKDDCPIELEEISKEIVKNCKGLPLSIVVIGGLLTKYQGTREYWEYTLANTSSAINSEDNEHCSKILYTSFAELPIHLKPCFLYMGIFQEDSEIRVSKLIKLWIAEGFLKPIDDKSIEVVAEEYLMELVDRNLIIVHELGSTGNIKLCKIHDLLRDLCLREGGKQKFLERHIMIPGSPSKECYDSRNVTSRARSLIFHVNVHESGKSFRSADLRLLRIFKVERIYDHSCEYLPLHNVRCISTGDSSFPESLSARYYWNLQTLVSVYEMVGTFYEMWRMPLLRHVELRAIFSILDPPCDDFVLGNLQSLSRLTISQCREKVVKGIPNIKKLKIFCRTLDRGSLDCFNNLCHLHKLEHLNCEVHLLPPLDSPDKRFWSELQQHIVFPRSLKKLTLEGCLLHWEDITTKIGILPLLQVLKLERDAATGPDWVTVDGQFCSLKFLLIEFCPDLVTWRTDDAHFPRLEHLRLRSLDNLEELPSGIGEIPTLESIKLVSCSYSAIMSAKRILDEQEEFGNEGLKVQVIVHDYVYHAATLRSLARRNFEVEIINTRVRDGDGSSDSDSSGCSCADCRD